MVLITGTEFTIHNSQLQRKKEEAFERIGFWFSVDWLVWLGCYQIERFHFWSNDDGNSYLSLDKEYELHTNHHRYSTDSSTDSSADSSASVFTFCFRT
jgi:hypothetical protein